MVPAERRKQILNLLEKRHYMSVEELAKTLYVSLPTIRRDLNDLEAEGAVSRTHGGASYAMTGDFIIPFAAREKNLSEGKKIVGDIAAGLIENNDTMFIYSGTTTLAFVQHINPDYHLEVVTNGFTLARLLSRNPNMNVYLTAGRYSLDQDAVFGPEMEESFQKRYVKYGIFSCSGVDMRKGISAKNAELELYVSRTFRANCEKMVLLADHTKLNQTFFYRYLRMEDMDILVTDQDPGEEWTAFCAENNIELLY